MKFDPYSHFPILIPVFFVTVISYMCLTSGYLSNRQEGCFVNGQLRSFVLVSHRVAKELDRVGITCLQCQLRILYFIIEGEGFTQN